MRRLMLAGLAGIAIALALGATACWDEARIRALEEKVATAETQLNAVWVWADTMTVDKNPTTTPLSPQDPAYSYLQSRAICGVVQYVEQLHRITDKEARPADVKALCGPPDPDPVYPPLFPPPED